MLLLLILLFLVFSMLNINYSGIIWLTLFGGLVLISFFELIAFQICKKRYKVLGKLNIPKTILKDFLIFIAVCLMFYVFVDYIHLVDVESNPFILFFLEEPKYLGSNIFFLPILKTLIVDNTFFYITDKGITTKGNYFEDYLWEDFKEYSLIEEQSLIRFRKKNDKFLFVKYEESYFQENKIEITKVLNKNIAYV